ncbi:hypothetical protein AGMMS50276_21060 [Synergistales bacterium]|nr:hypothetical protein AGMMS50276_21060 [Synergistales bacterium]
MNTSINKWARGKLRAVALTAALLFGLMLSVAPLTAHAVTEGAFDITVTGGYNYASNTNTLFITNVNNLRTRCDFPYLLFAS